jgi:hypothetical protein
MKFTDEHKRKLSESHKGKKQSQEQIEKRVAELKGKKRSYEFKKRVSEWMKNNKNGIGHKVSEEAKRKISEANRGNHYALGTIRSEETRRKIGLTNSMKIHLKGNKASNWKGGISHKYLLMKANRKKPEQCEICGSLGKICFDHDHKTGEFRGWICLRCNSTLGFVKDNKELLQTMIEYLQKNAN